MPGGSGVGAGSRLQPRSQAALAPLTRGLPGVCEVSGPLGKELRTRMPRSLKDKEAHMHTGEHLRLQRFGPGPGLPNTAQAQGAWQCLLRVPVPEKAECEAGSGYRAQLPGNGHFSKPPEKAES